MPDPAKNHHGIRRVAALCGITLWSYTHHRPRQPFWVPNEKSLNDDSNLPSIGLVTPTYEHGQFLRGAIESVVNQNYPKLSYVVCDGGSGDHSAEILREFDSELTCWISSEDNGQSDAINRGFAMVQEAGVEPEIMGWLNADDRHLPWTLRTVGRYFRDHPDVDVVYGHRVVCNPHGQVVGRWVLPKHRPGAILWRDYVPQETLFWRKRVWDRIGSQVNSSRQFAMDWDLLVKFYQSNATFMRLPCYLGIFTAHPHQKSQVSKGTIGVKEFAAIREHLLSRESGTSFLRRVARRTTLQIGSALYILEAALWEWARRLRAIP